MLTSLKFKTNFLSGVFYQETVFDELLFIVFDNGAAKTPAVNLTSFGGILSKPSAYLT